MQLNYPLIGFTGRAGAGKDTVADFSIKYLRSKNKMSSKLACAEPLKQICAQVFGRAYHIPDRHFYGSQAEKETPLEAIPGWTGRRILQYIGTEGFRHVDSEVWPRLMLAEARNRIEVGHHAVFVSDVRFLSEAQKIQRSGGLVVRIKNPMADQTPSAHASETELAEIREDYTIDNQGRELYLLEILVEEFLCQLHF